MRRRSSSSRQTGGGGLARDVPLRCKASGAAPGAGVDPATKPGQPASPTAPSRSRRKATAGSRQVICPTAARLASTSTRTPSTASDFQASEGDGDGDGDGDGIVEWRASKSSSWRERTAACSRGRGPAAQSSAPEALSEPCRAGCSRPRRYGCQGARAAGPRRHSTCACCGENAPFRFTGTASCLGDGRVSGGCSSASSSKGKVTSSRAGQASACTRRFSGFTLARRAGRIVWSVQCTCSASTTNGPMRTSHAAGRSPP